MTITPTGSPSWVRNSDYTTYGGNVDKVNYQGQGKVNARTDVDAEEFARLTADLAAIMRTAAFCTITFTCRDTAVLDPLVTDVTMQPSGVVTSSYAGGSPPAGFPAVTRNATGDYTITFSSSYNDPYGVAGAWGPSHAIPGVHSTTGVDVGVALGASTVQVYASVSGSPSADNTISVSIW